MTLYELLGVPTTCTDDEFKAAYRRKCKELHPDTNGGDPGKTKLFIKMKEVYEKALKNREAARRAPMTGPTITVTVNGASWTQAFNGLGAMGAFRGF
jgi:DnaJ-class molecular chaperone